MRPDPRLDPRRLICRQTRLLIAAVGLDATVSLLTQRGGTRIRLPRSADHALTLQLLLGSESAARKFVAAFGDVEYVYLPKAHKIVAELRNQTIRRERARGDTLNAIAIRHDLTVAWIKKVLAEDEAAPRPVSGDLFAVGAP